LGTTDAKAQTANAVNAVNTGAELPMEDEGSAARTFTGSTTMLRRGQAWAARYQSAPVWFFVPRSSARRSSAGAFVSFFPVDLERDEVHRWPRACADVMCGQCVNSVLARANAARRRVAQDDCGRFDD